MGGKHSREATGTEKKRNKKVDKLLERKNPLANAIRILLLGSGESGKTTVFKQMCMLKGKGFGPEYFRGMKAKLCGNIVDGTFHIIKNAEKQGMALSPDISDATARMIQQRSSYFNETVRNIAKEDQIISARIKQNPIDHITPELASSLSTLWQDESFKEAYRSASRHGKTDVADSYPELMQNLVDKYPQWGGKDWTPDNRDILLVRVRTTGMAEESFQIDRVYYTLIDVGGQRAERRKWFHLFNNITAIMYVASLSEYDQTLFEDNKANRLLEAIDVFKSVAEHQSFEGAAVLLFLNKFDLLLEKYVQMKIPINISGSFPSAPKVEDETDTAKCDIAVDWFTQQYVSNLSADKVKTVFVHTTCALDGGQMQAVIQACTTHILEENMRRSGFLPNM